jgi:hypothetical protein
MSRSWARALTAVRAKVFTLDVLGSLPSRNRDRRILQPFIRPYIRPMAGRVSRNQKACDWPLAHHHIRDCRNRNQVSHVRFRLRYLLALLAHPPKPNKLLQHAPTRISPPSTGLQRAPRPRQHERRAARSAGLPRRRREMDKGVGDHAIREEHLPRAPCRSLFQSRTTVGPLPSLPAPPADALHTEIRPTTTSSRTSAR